MQAAIMAGMSDRDLPSAARRRVAIASLERR
jgi:hypothetical protein